MSIKASIEGNAAWDGDLKYGRSGTPWSRCRLGCYAGKDQEGNARTMWIDVLAFNDMAETLSGMRKGNLVRASGRMELDQWEDKDGNKRETIKLLADHVGHGERKAKGAKQASAHRAGPPPAQQEADFDDDIPF